MTVRMWEVRAAGDSAADALVDWLLAVGLPAVAEGSGYERAEVFSGSEQRVVVLTWWNGASHELPQPPADLLARPAHAWDFRSVAVRWRSLVDRPPADDRKREDST